MLGGAILPKMFHPMSFFSSSRVYSFPPYETVLGDSVTAPSLSELRISGRVSSTRRYGPPHQSLSVSGAPVFQLMKLCPMSWVTVSPSLRINAFIPSAP